MMPLVSLLLACASPPAEEPLPLAAPVTTKAPPWVVGGEVPGWPDVGCDPGLSATRYRFDNPTQWRMVGEIAEVAGRVRPVRITIETRDCGSFSCDDTQPRASSTPYLLASLSLSGDDGLADATGWWGPDATTARTVRGSGYSVFGRAGNYTRNGHGDNAEVSVCLSRVRPDSVTGVLFFRLTTPGDPVQFQWVDAVEFWSPFSFTLPEHAGTSGAADAQTGGTEGRDDALVWRYLGVSYDDAWPWASITDGAIHDALYNAYTPGP